ncbi:MAG: hypothetical protein ABFD18_10560 [Syntrophomonas sp.]
MERQIGLDELISDINQSKSAEIEVYLSTGIGLGVRKEKVKELRVEKDEEGYITLGIELDVKAINNEHEIYKSEDLEEPESTSYEIRENGLLLLTLNLSR